MTGFLLKCLLSLGRGEVVEGLAEPEEVEPEIFMGRVACVMEHSCVALRLRDPGLAW